MKQGWKIWKGCWKGCSKGCWKGIQFYKALLSTDLAPCEQFHQVQLNSPAPFQEAWSCRAVEHFRSVSMSVKWQHGNHNKQRHASLSTVTNYPGISSHLSSHLNASWMSFSAPRQHRNSCGEFGNTQMRYNGATTGNWDYWDGGIPHHECDGAVSLCHHYFLTWSREPSPRPTETDWDQLRPTETCEMDWNGCLSSRRAVWNPTWSYEESKAPARPSMTNTPECVPASCPKEKSANPKGGLYSQLYPHDMSHEATDSWLIRAVNLDSEFPHQGDGIQTKYAPHLR